MTPEDLKIMQARLAAKGVAQDAGYELGRKLLALYDGKTLSRPASDETETGMAATAGEGTAPKSRSGKCVGPTSANYSANKMDVTQGRESLTCSKLEDRFYELWIAFGGPPLCREHRIFGHRKWRADFAHLTSQTIIEVDGGVEHGIWRTRKDGQRVWVPGGHGMEGRVRDCKRDLECVLNGWRVVRLVPSMITVDNIERLIAFVKGNSCQNKW